MTPSGKSSLHSAYSRNNPSRRDKFYPKIAVVHQPSGPVIEGIARAVARQLPQAPPIRFLLPELARSNSSSATTLVAWQGMIEKGEIDPGEPFLLAAPGIGSVISAAVIRPR